jgi:hypothetical protein
VSFFDREGQSMISRTVQCTENGEYELEENGGKAVVTGIDCIVAYRKDEL